LVSVLGRIGAARAKLYERDNLESNAIPKSGQKFPETEEIFAQAGMTAPLQLDQD